MVQSLGSVIAISLLQSHKVLRELGSGHAEVKLEEIAVFFLMTFSSLFLKTIEHEHMTPYTNCDAFLYPIIYESVHLCPLPVQLLSWTISSELLFHYELCHARK